MISFEFAHPKYLFGLILLSVLLWSFRYSLVDFSRRQRLVSLGLRSLILVLIVLAVAGATLMSSSRERKVVFLLDRSRSIDADAAAKARDYIDRACRFAGTASIPVVPFASEAGAPLSADDPEILSENKSADPAWQNGTDIAAALESALPWVSPRYVPHLVLLSDGNETAGDALSVAARIDATISVVPLPPPARPEVQLDELRVPANVLQGEPFHIDVVVRSNVDTEGTVALYRGEHREIEERKSIRAGENVFRFRQTVDDRRRQDFSATVVSRDDTILENNHAGAILYIGGKPRVLIVEADPKSVRDFVSALREQEIAVEVRPPEGMPETLDELDSFEALILSNVPAETLPPHRMELIRTYTSELGGGFMMLGGDHSFGPGGYYKTPVDEILPVQCDLEEEKPALAMCLVIDRSGSMGGRKMELAKEAAKSAVELLTPKDFVAVIAFDHESYIVSPIQNVETPSRINTLISTIEAAGGTNIHPGLTDAHDQLRSVSAKLKHVILLTDGHSAPGNYREIVRRMTDDGITVSTIGVADADNELLAIIARLGKGRHYVCEDPKSIPQIFARETLAASRTTLRDLPVLPLLVTPTDVLSEFDFDAAPPLLGFVSTPAKPTAQVILATETGEPLLAWWRFGLGMSAAFSSDVKNHWGAEWLVWPDYARFWAQVVRHIMRGAEHRAEERGATLTLTRRSGRIDLALDVVDQADRYVDEGIGRVTVVRPDLGKGEFPLRRTAPGRYEASIPAEKQGGYHLTVSFRTGDREAWNLSRGIVVGYPAELRLLPTREEGLRRLAETTGGLYDPEPDALFAADPNRAVWRGTPLGSRLLALAAFLFVFDVLLRRFDLARWKADRNVNRRNG